MYFDFEDYRPDITPVGSAISRREGALISFVLHGLFGLFILLAPPLGGGPTPEEIEARLAQERQLALERAREAERFVFVAPRMDLEALKPPPRAELSDMDREARSPERAERPANPLPFARGNSAERVEAPPRTEPSRVETRPRAGVPEGLDTSTPDSSDSPGVDESLEGLRASAAPPPRPGDGGTPPLGAGSALGDALRNLQRYVDQESFDNPQGGAGAFGPWIQFDTKGVEFGPWVRRFVAQIKRNWFIPYAAMAFKGHVVLTFYVHKDGRISALAIQKPSDVDAFNQSAFNALVASNPTQPLPPEYPSEQAFFTVTFFYNESPP